MNNDRTIKALGEQLIGRLGETRFCIVGCGGTGANFAELLVRTGAKHITLIDGDLVKDTDLNRIWSFEGNDAQSNSSKVKALKERLEKIAGNNVMIEAIEEHFMESNQIVTDRESVWKAHRAVYQSTTDLIFIAVDKNKTRRSIESLTQDKESLSCGIMIDMENDKIEFECSWNPKTPVETESDEGYGPNNGSYGAIVAEATSVAFSMLLNHLGNGTEKIMSYKKEYDANFIPVKVEIATNERSICTLLER